MSPRIYRGPIRVRITERSIPAQTVVAIRHFLSTYAQERTIWLDGRPHPPEEAPHTWMGFSTGEWQGRVLKVRTTHIKQGWHRRNGIPMSAKAVMTEYFIRHDNVLTQVSITEDPIFLEEPLVKTTNLLLDAATTPNQYQAWLFCQADDEFPDAIRRMCRTIYRGRIPISLSSRHCTDCPSSRRAVPRRCIRIWTRSSRCPYRRRRHAGEVTMIKKLFIVVAAVMIGALSAHVDGRAQVVRRHRLGVKVACIRCPFRASSSSSAQGRTSRCRSAVLDRSSICRLCRMPMRSWRQRQLTGRFVTSSTRTRTLITLAETKVGASGAPISGRGVAVVGAGKTRAEIIAHEDMNRMVARWFSGAQ